MTQMELSKFTVTYWIFNRKKHKFLNIMTRVVDVEYIV